MPIRRILSLWFPHLPAERVLRHMHLDAPLAITDTQANMVRITGLCARAAAEGLRLGQAVADARTLCPDLVTRPAEPTKEAIFLTRLMRWAGKYSPWVSVEKPDALLLDISGCAHLFGGEEAMANAVVSDCARFRLSVRVGLADTVGAAWALSRYAGTAHAHTRSGDAIQQEARATRSRAYKRRNWERGGTRPVRSSQPETQMIAPPGDALAAIATLPLAALRLDGDVVTRLNRLGLHQIRDLVEIPRGAVGRRFGADVLRRLDQALGVEPEPVSPGAAPKIFATRLSMPEPIGLAGDIRAALDRLLPPLCEKLRLAGQGARVVQASFTRSDHSLQMVEVRLAQTSHDPQRIMPLLTLKLPDIEPGFGIDMVRLHATVTEPLNAKQHSGHAIAVSDAKQRRDTSTAHADLLGRIGARIGLEQMIALEPTDSHIPEKTARIVPAAFAEKSPLWHHPRTPRPIVLFPPEPVVVTGPARPPERFTWRRMALELSHADGPERIAPEWWLDDPNWRSGTRDYWRVKTTDGRDLWLFQALGAALNGGWFCQGDFG